MRARALNERSAFLLRALHRLAPLGISPVTWTKPWNAPAGLSMMTLRGLQRRGFVAERHNRIFYITDAGKKWCDEHPEVVVPKFEIKFHARQKGALGLGEDFREVVEAADRNAAVLKLYDNYEHISIDEIKES